MTIYAILLDDLNSSLGSEWQASDTEIGGYDQLIANVDHLLVKATFIKSEYTRQDIRPKSLNYLGQPHSGFIVSLT